MPSEALALFVADEPTRAERFDPNALAFEAFKLTKHTFLLEPIEATDLAAALAEATERWNWERGDRMGMRELGDGIDRFHIYAVRRGARPIRYVGGQSVYKHSLDHICSIDLNVIAGIPVGLIGMAESDLHLRRQHLRPEGARFERDSL